MRAHISIEGAKSIQVARKVDYVVPVVFPLLVSHS
jgi:hypothetical protein